MCDRTPVAAGTTSKFGNWFHRALIVATLLTCAVAVSPNQTDPDLWGHVQYGRDAIAEGLPFTTTYSYTAQGYRWINHENLAELLLATGIDTIGPIGMLIAKCMLGVGIISLMMIYALRRGAALLTVCVVALLVAVNLSYFWSLRPHILSCAYYTLMLALLSWCFSGWEGRCQWPWLENRNKAGADELRYSSRHMRFLWLGVPLFFLWANTHGGFVAGYCIYIAYLGLRGCEAWVRNRRASFGLLRRLVMMAGAAGLATLVNPYGPRLHLWLFESLRVPRPEIVEWHAPDLTSTIMVPLWLIMFSWFSVLLLTQRSRDLTHLIIMTLTLFQALSHVRHIPFFAIPFGFWMAPHVDSVLKRFRVTSHTSSFGADMSPILQRAFVSVLCLAFGLLGYKLFDRLSDMPVDRDEYPVAAFQYIADQDLRGRMVVTYNWAQYAIAVFGPKRVDEQGIRVSFDGRFRTCYPQEVVDMNFDFVLGHLEPRYRGPDSPPFDDERVLEYGQPDLVLVNRKQPHSINVLFHNTQSWALLYQDQIVQLWGRRSKYDHPSSPDYLDPTARLISEQVQEGSVTWPALPSDRVSTQLASFSRPSPSSN